MRVTEKGQVTIPRNVRRKLGIVPGSEVEFSLQDDAAILRRASPSDVGGEVVATVRLWHVEAGVDRLGRPVAALLLGPLAVDSAREGQGIGAALMRAAIAEAKQRGHGAILLVGDPEYYERFGFFADKARHLVMPGPFERRRFLGLELTEGWLDDAAGVIVASGARA